MTDNTSYEAVTPGQRLGYAQEYIAGNGTYERNGLLCASVVGIRHITTPDDENQLPIISVSKEKEQSAVPDVGSLVRQLQHLLIND
ncbi:unnamed protein product [Absidia cylindrospora]